MSKDVIYHLFDYVDKKGEQLQITRKYLNTSDLTYTLKTYPVAGKRWNKVQVFHGQRVDGYVRGEKYILTGIFADPNTYH
jgi:hypothetical protein